MNGPGNRAVIWVQGCTLGCRRCWNPDTHTIDSGQEVSITEMVTWASFIPDIEGVTISGGEPMQQAPDLLLFISRLKSIRPELSIGMYTGYTLKELEADKYHYYSYYDRQIKNASGIWWRGLKNLLDFAVMGRYVEAKRSQERPLCGSSNQEIIFFSDRYSEKDLSQQGFELSIDDNSGLVQITGFPIGVDLTQL